MFSDQFGGKIQPCFAIFINFCIYPPPWMQKFFQLFLVHLLKHSKVSEYLSQMGINKTLWVAIIPLQYLQFLGAVMIMLIYSWEGELKNWKCIIPALWLLVLDLCSQSMLIWWWNQIEKTWNISSSASWHLWWRRMGCSPRDRLVFFFASLFTMHCQFRPRQFRPRALHYY